MFKYGGHAGKILEINLTAKEISTQKIKPKGFKLSNIPEQSPNFLQSIKTRKIDLHFSYLSGFLPGKLSPLILTMVE